MILVRSAVFHVVFYVTFIALMILGLPCLLLPRAATMGLVRLWTNVSLKLLAAICGTRIEFRNLHLLPKGGSLLAVKHQSFLEIIALITVLDDYSFVLKKELLAIPFFGWYARRADQIGIDREKRAATLAKLQSAVRDKLAEGRQVVIFPEGTRRLIGLPPAYKPGVAALVADSHVPCTPVALNSGLFWPRRGFLRRPGTVVIEFLPPIAPDLPRRDFMKAVQDAIEPATDALVARALADDPRLREAMAREMAERPADQPQKRHPAAA